VIITLALKKSTDYVLSVELGSANCGAPPTTGFCADTDFEGVNVWTGITSSSVWSYVRSDWKDEEAQCRFEELVDRCPFPTPECRQWLKIFSCLESFPQCDGSGFQVGICRDVCEQVEDVCGPFLAGVPHEEFACCSSKYVDTVGNSTADTTCYTLPPPPPPPPGIPSQNLGSDSSAFPPSLETPSFSTIFAQIPPASEFFKDAEVVREVVQNSASAHLLPVTVLVLAIVAMLL